MEKVVRIFKSFEEADQADKEYYRNLTPEQRLDILLEINGRWPFFNNGETSDRLARVYRIIDYGGNVIKSGGEIG
jgi:hypothetical protein